MASTGTSPAKISTGSGSAASEPSAPPRVHGGMNWFYWIAFAIPLCLGAATMVWSSRQSHPQNVNDSLAQTTNAAFRDGLYAGKLAGERGAAPHVAAGRWSSQEDRASFTAGYQEGYSESLAVRPATIKHSLPAE